MNKEMLSKAARTLISMCTDYLFNGISEEVFVSNLEIFAEQCKKALHEEDVKEDS